MQKAVWWLGGLTNHSGTQCLVPISSLPIEEEWKAQEEDVGGDPYLPHAPTVVQLVVLEESVRPLPGDLCGSKAAATPGLCTLWWPCLPFA